MCLCIMLCSSCNRNSWWLVLCFVCAIICSVYMVSVKLTGSRIVSLFELIFGDFYMSTKISALICHCATNPAYLNHHNIFNIYQICIFCDCISYIAQIVENCSFGGTAPLIVISRDQYHTQKYFIRTPVRAGDRYHM